MNDRQRLEAIIKVIGQYLPPDGIPINDAMSEIISLVDPLPQQELAAMKIEDAYVRNYLWERGLIAVDEDPKLREEKQQ